MVIWLSYGHYMGFHKPLSQTRHIVFTVLDSARFQHETLGALCDPWPVCHETGGANRTSPGKKASLLKPLRHNVGIAMDNLWIIYILYICNYIYIYIYIYIIL